jgi:glycosyltransferase involved in cell wall biosynthesis
MHCMSSGAAGREPLVTIGVPVYNGERFLEATLDCLLAQTYRNIEIIVSDNASTDGTAAICARYAQRDRRVQHARTEINVGASGNIRRLAGMLRGEYFKLSNADDLVEPEFVARCVEVLESDPTVALVCTLSRLIDMDDRQLRNEPRGSLLAHPCADPAYQFHPGRGQGRHPARTVPAPWQLRWRGHGHAGCHLSARWNPSDPAGDVRSPHA